MLQNCAPDDWRNSINYVEILKMVHRGNKRRKTWVRNRLPYQSRSPQFYSRGRSLSAKLASICSRFYRSGEISVSTAIQDVRLSVRAPSLIPMQVEILQKAPTTFPGEMSRLPRVSPHDPFSSTILARTTVPFQPSSIQSLLLSLPSAPSSLVLSVVVPSRPFVFQPPSTSPRSYYPFSHSQVSLLDFIVFWRQQIFLILLFNLTKDAIFFLISTLTILRERRWSEERGRERAEGAQF